MGNPIRVLIVDDSVFLRHTLTKNLEADPDLTVVGSAVDGLDALEKVRALTPDVVILDVEMPRMDGLTALQRIMTECSPTRVVMLSALTQRGTRTTIQALIRGAVDFVPKPAAGVHIKSVIDELIAKVKLAATTPLPTLPTTLPLSPRAQPASRLGPRPFRKGDPLVVIGASTGGPRALQTVISRLPADLPAAMAVVQHMPPAFTQSLAQRLDESAAITVHEAALGNGLQQGLALLAPGDYHMRFDSAGLVVLDQGPRRNHLRPAVDVTMESAAERYGAAVIGVVLTGMGSDGKEGSACIKAAGGKVVAEHESTCVIYGMPRSVVEANLADQVVPLPKVADTIVELVEALNR